MTVWGVSSTRDEDDILEASTRHMLSHCDKVLIEDHGSVDTTPEILARLAYEFGDRLEVITDPDAPFDSSLTRLQHRAEAEGATWIVPFDTDEVWQAWGPLHDLLPLLDADHVVATVYEHVPQIGDQGPDPLRAIGCRREAPWPWQKVAVRATVGMTIGHHETTNGGRPFSDGIEVRHFPYRSAEQARKRIARNVEHSETNWHPDVYRAMGENFDQWWAEFTAPRGLVLDPARVR